MFHSNFPRKVRLAPTPTTPRAGLTFESAPSQGVNFLDIFPIFRDPVALEVLVTNLSYHLTSHTMPNLANGKIDVIVSLDARGFLLGPLIASRLKAAFVPVRKRGKLPGKCLSVEYEKEYGRVILFFFLSLPFFGRIWPVVSVLIFFFPFAI